MNIWFLHDIARFRHERDTLQRLVDGSTWLLNADWKIENKTLIVEFIIRCQGYDYHLKMIYPEMFPFIQPIVQPINALERLSNHQYSSGTLCLEWGPDNWHPDITGAQLIESAYRLLNTENPRGEGDRSLVASRHYLSLGQELRHGNNSLRLYCSSELLKYLESIKPDNIGQFYFKVQNQSNSVYTLFIQEIKLNYSDDWIDDSLPQGIRGIKDNLTMGYLLKVDAQSAEIENIKTVDDIENLISVKLSDLISDNVKSFGFLIIDPASQPHFYIIFDYREKNSVIPAYPIISELTSNNRIPENLEGLSQKKVGIVGLGSVGSKICVSFARMGVREFYLVDEDIFLPENVCRHELDWTNVGEHKVDAIKEILLSIAPNMNIDTVKYHLTGQESNSSISTAMNALGKCDLIIDATADPNVFNLLAAVSKNFSRPLLWAQVYPGGTGGMIARSRPGKDPDAFTVRAAYIGFCSQYPNYEMTEIINYEASDHDGKVFSASDADVSIIAGHAAHLAVDTILDYEPSNFPFSIYLIGLKKAWIFEEPFDIRPLDVTKFINEKKSDQPNVSEYQNEIQFIQQLLTRMSDDNSTS